MRRVVAAAVALATVLALAGCGMLPHRTKAGPKAKPLPSDPCSLIPSETEKLLIPDARREGSGGQTSPAPDSTVAAQCTLHSKDLLPALEVTIIRFPPGGAKRYSGFATPAEQYDSCVKQFLTSYFQSTQLRERFTVGFGDKSDGAFDAGYSRNSQPVITVANVCVLAGDDFITSEYRASTNAPPPTRDALKQAAVLGAAETLRHLPG